MANVLEFIRVKPLPKPPMLILITLMPLAHAHRHGADKWTRAQRRAFANDFDNLVVVGDAINKAKSDKATHEWLPPLKSYWCEYGKRWEYIKEKYELRYSKQERFTLKQLAKAC